VYVQPRTYYTPAPVYYERSYRAPTVVYVTPRHHRRDHRRGHDRYDGYGYRR